MPAVPAGGQFLYILAQYQRLLHAVIAKSLLPLLNLTPDKDQRLNPFIG